MLVPLLFFAFPLSVSGAGIGGTCKCGGTISCGVTLNSCDSEMNWVPQCWGSVPNCQCDCVCNEPCGGFSNNCDATGTRCGQSCTRTVPVSGACGTVQYCSLNNECGGVRGDPSIVDYDTCNGEWCYCSSSNWVANDACDCDRSSNLCTNNAAECGIGSKWLSASVAYSGVAHCCGDDTGEGSPSNILDFLIRDAVYPTDPCASLDAGILAGECDLQHAP